MGCTLPPSPDTVNQWAVRILLECILVYIKHFQEYENEVSYKSWPKTLTESEVSGISPRCVARKLEKEEIERYGRQMILPEIGLQGLMINAWIFPSI